MVPGHLQKPIKEHTNAQPSCCCKLLDVHCKTPHASSQLEKQKLANPAVESPAPACLACTCCCGQRWSQCRSCLPCLYCAASLAFLLLPSCCFAHRSPRPCSCASEAKGRPPASKPADAERRPAPARARARRHRLQALLAAAGLWGRAWWADKPPCKAGDSARRRRRLVCSLPARTNRKRPKRETKIKQQNNSN